jgi:ferritin-like metal-binding protein YciE
MSDTNTTPPLPVEAASVEIATVEVIPGPAPSAARTTRAPRAGKSAPRARRKKSAAGGQKAELEAVRKELTITRDELGAARAELGELVAACRDAEERVAATRADADSIRRLVSAADATAAQARGVAESARADVDGLRDAARQTEERLGKLHQWLAEARQDFASLDAESRQAIEDFRAAVEELRAAGSGEFKPAPAQAGGEDSAAPSGAGEELPEVDCVPPGERAEDLRERFVRLLNDAWAAEKEQAGLLQTLADECDAPDLRAALEEGRAACQARQEEVEVRIKSFGAQPSGGRGLLGQLVTRVWDAVQAPHDKADRAVQALLKALGAAEFQAGLYAAAHACARAAGGEETAGQLADFFRQERRRADRLRDALAPTVGRAARR